jgi:hypothetical protein
MATRSTAVVWISRIAFCVVGLSCAVAASVAQDVYHPPEMSWMSLGLKLLDALGVSLLIMGLLTSVLELPHWKEYFEHRLSDVIVGQEYLRELRPEALLKQQVKVFQIYYHDEQISDSGFVSYCLRKIHGYVVKPYRSNVHDYIRISKAGPDLLRIENDLRYVLRKAGGRIQKRVGWQANSMEVVRMDELKLDLVWPDSSEKAGQVLAHAEMKDFALNEDPDGSLSYEYSLEPYKDLDGLIVNIRAEYLVEPSAFYTWRMIDPSDRVELNIKYPSDLKIQFKHFLLEKTASHEIRGADFFHVTFDSWVMPRSGFAWKLLSPDVAVKVGTAQAVTAQPPAQLQPELLLNRNAEVLQEGVS